MRRITAVIADDHPAMRELVREVLQREGVEVIGEAADGLAAVELALELEPDVIVLDIRMPELGGDTAAQVLRTFDAAVGLILLSSEPSLATATVRDSVDAVLSKTDILRLPAAVHDAVHEHRGCRIRIA